jgi:hypothetical protein
MALIPICNTPQKSTNGVIPFGALQTRIESLVTLNRYAWMFNKVAEAFKNHFPLNINKTQVIVKNILPCIIIYKTNYLFLV